MFNSDFGRTLAAIACTLVFSATCVVGAVGPAQAGPLTAGAAATGTAARLVA